MSPRATYDVLKGYTSAPSQISSLYDTGRVLAPINNPRANYTATSRHNVGMVQGLEIIHNGQVGFVCLDRYK